MDIESIVERLNAIGEWQVEYETTHKDSGDNYAYLVVESWHSEQESRLVAYMAEKGIDWSGLEIDAIADSVLDQFTMESSHIWGMGNGACLIASFPVGEIEIQIDAKEIGVDVVTPELCESLSRQADVYVTRQDDSTILAYQATDSVWGAVISEESLRAIVQDLRESD